MYLKKQNAEEAPETATQEKNETQNYHTIIQQYGWTETFHLMRRW